MGIFDFIRGIKEYKEFHSNGKIKEKFFKNRSGSTEGLVKMYNEDGNKISQLNIVPVEIVSGEINTWYSNGKKCSKGEINMGCFVNEIITYYYNGNTQSKVNLRIDYNKYKNSKKTPFDSEYGVEGSIKPIKFWVNIGMRLDSNVTEFGLWYSEDGTSEEVSIHEIRKRHVQYIDDLKTRELSLYFCNDLSENYEKKQKELYEKMGFE